MSNYELPSTPHAQPAPQDSTDMIALVIEIIFGFFGLLGMGWLYAGNFVNAIVIFIGYWILVGIEVFVTTLTAGICGCLVIPLNLVLIIVSGIKVRDYVRQTGAKGSVMYVIIATVLALLLVCVVGVIAVVALGGLAAVGDSLNNLQY